MNSRKRRVALYGLGIAVLCLSIVLFILSFSRSYMGVDIRLKNESWTVTSVDPGGLAQATGIESGNVVTTVNGKDPSLFAVTSGRIPATGIETIDYIDTNGNPKSASVADAELPILGRTRVECVLFLFMGLAFWVTGVWILLKRIDSQAARQLYLLCLSVCLVYIGTNAFVRDIAGIKYIQMSNFAILIPLFLYFFLIFPEPKRLRVGNRNISWIVFLPALIILVIYALYGHNDDSYYTWFQSLLNMYLALGLLLGLVLLVHSYFTATYGRPKQQTKIIMIGALAGILPLVFLSILPETLGGSTWVASQFTVIGTILFPVALAYSIAQHKLLDIDFYLSRALVYGIVTVSLITVYILLTFGLSRITGSLTDIQLISVIIVISCIAILSFPFVRAKIQGRIDHTFYKDRYDYRQSLRSIGATLSSGADLVTINNYIVSIISETLGLSGACLFLRDGEGMLQLSHATGIYEGGEKVDELAGQIENLKETEKFPEKAPEQLGVDFVAPLMVGKREIGFLCLGRKLSRVGFTVDDISFVLTFSTQAATAIENAILLEKAKEDSIRLRTMYRKLEEHATSLRESKEELEQTYIDMATTLITALESRDPYTRGHTERVTHLARRLGTTLGLGEDRLQVLELAGRFHDIGKISIPDSVLLKPGALDSWEMTKVKSHPSEGVDMLRFLPVLENVLPFIEAHHEWYNGKGYPSGLKGEGIPLEARIIAVADAYDAMTSDRPYRKAFSRREAIKRLEEGAGTQWDPHIVKVFISIRN